MSYFSDQAGGGTPAASLKLHAIGAGFWGTIESVSEVDQKKYNSDEVLKDAAGNNVKQLRVILQGTPDNYATASKPLTGEDGSPMPDDGRRAVYIPRNTNLSFRTADALREVGKLDEGLEVGGMLSIQYVEDIPTTKGNPARGHAVKYKAPEPKPQSSGAYFQGQQQAAAQVQAQPPVQAAPPQAPPVQQPPVQPQPGQDPFGNAGPPPF